MSAKKKKKKVKLKGILRLLFIVGGLSLLIIKLIQWNSLEDNATYFLTEGEIAVTDAYRGIIVRDEFLVSSNFSGQVTQLANDGDLVKKNQRIMDITRGAELAVSPEDIEEEPVESAELPNEVTKEYLELLILNIKKDIALAIKEENYSVVPELSSSLSLQIETLKQKNDMKEVPSWIQTVGDDSVAVGEKISVMAKESGVLTYYIDGFEEAFTYDRVASLQFDQLIEMDIKPDLAAAYEVRPGDILCKIINDNHYYIIIVADQSKYKQYNLYTDVEIQTDTQKVTGSIEKFIAAGDQVAIAIKLTSYIEDFHKKRFIDITIKQEAYQGLTLKTSSIVNTDQGLGVYVVNKVGQVAFKPIQVIYNTGDTAVVKQDIFYEFDETSNKRIDTVSLHDRVIRIAEDYKVGDKIK